MRRSLVPPLLSLIIVAAAVVARGDWNASQGQTVDFDEVGIGKALGQESEEAAVSRAKDDAMSKVLRQSADVFYGFSDYSAKLGKKNYESVARYLFTSSRGLVVEESDGKPECSINDAVTTCRVRIRGKVALRGAIDPSFQILDADSGKPLGLDKRRYHDGDSVKMRLAASKDAFLYVFSWDSRDNLFLVFPNRLQRSNHAKAAQVLDVPGKGSGIAYKAVLPAGATLAMERLVIVATKAELVLPDAARDEKAGPYSALSLGTMAEVMRRLANFDRQDWTLQVIPYEILPFAPNALPAPKEGSGAPGGKT